MSLFLGIDTSNYTTSAALYDSEKKLMLQEKKLLPVKSGERGLRQSDAVFHHTLQLPEILKTLLKDIDCRDIAAVGVSSRPRSVDGSYMPCFMVGRGFSQAVSSALDVPLFEFSHQDGHITAALYSANKIGLLDDKFIAFHVSGGTTEALLVTADKNPNKINVKIVGKTLDLNAGQLVDRVGVKLGLNFPCGKELEKLALSCDESVKPKPVLKDCDCCISGAENKCADMLSRGEAPEKIALFALMYIEKTLEKMTENIFEKYGEMPLLFAGGVMSNAIIRRYLEDRFGAFFAKPEFSSDNAAGIAYCAYREYASTNIIFQ